MHVGIMLFGVGLVVCMELLRLSMGPDISVVGMVYTYVGSSDRAFEIAETIPINAAVTVIPVATNFNSPSTTSLSPSVLM